MFYPLISTHSQKNFSSIILFLIFLIFFNFLKSYPTIDTNISNCLEFFFHPLSFSLSLSLLAWWWHEQKKVMYRWVYRKKRKKMRRWQRLVCHKACFKYTTCFALRDFTENNICICIYMKRKEKKFFLFFYI